MQNLVLVVHVITAISIIAFILIQQGKGAEAGASFGAGASQTIFGSSGTWNFFSKVTALLATVFFITSMSLAIIARNQAAIPDTLLPAIEQFQAEQPSTEPPLDLPVLEQDFPSNETDIPSSEFDVPLEDTEYTEIPDI